MAIVKHCGAADTSDGFEPSLPSQRGDRACTTGGSRQPRGGAAGDAAKGQQRNGTMPGQGCPAPRAESQDAWVAFRREGRGEEGAPNACVARPDQVGCGMGGGGGPGRHPSRGRAAAAAEVTAGPGGQGPGSRNTQGNMPTAAQAGDGLEGGGAVRVGVVPEDDAA